MDFYCLRHPRPDVEAGVCYGRKDISLKPFNPQAIFKNLEPLVQRKKIVRVFTSPLIRCQEPAQLISQNFNLPLETDPRLMELNFGQWEGQSFDQLWVHSREYRYWCSHWKTAAPPEGESLVDAIQRVQDFLNNQSLHQSLIITHSGIIRIFYHIFNHGDLDDFFQITPDYGSLSSFENL